MASIGPFTKVSPSHLFKQRDASCVVIRSKNKMLNGEDGNLCDHVQPDI